MPTYHYLFLLRGRNALVDNDGKIYIDSFYTFTTGEGGDFPVPNAKTLTAADRIAERITEPRFKKKMDELQTAVMGMTLRRRFNSSDMKGPFHVTSDSKISIDDLEIIIQNKEGAELKRFIKEAHL